MKEYGDKAKRVAELLLEKGLTIAVAEATCCGLIGYLLTSVPGSSKYFLGGLSPYSRHGKSPVLGIPDTLLIDKGSVSSETAVEVARRVRELFDSDIGLAETGIAGPGGGTVEKPVGLFYIAISTRPGHEISKEYRFGGGREETRQQAAQAALELIEGHLQQRL